MKSIIDLYLDHADTDSFERSEAREAAEKNVFSGHILKLTDADRDNMADEIMSFACACEQDGYTNGFKQAVQIMSECAKMKGAAKI